MVAWTTLSIGCGWKFGWDDYGGLPGDETGDAPSYDPSYFIGECTDYQKCPNTPLNDVGFGAKAALEASGWSGVHKLNSGVRLTQFIDGNLWPQVGFDATGADAHDFVIYAGHANVGWIQVSWTDPDTQGCVMDIGKFMALGTGTGDAAAVLAMVSSCSGYATRDEKGVPINGCFRRNFLFSELRQVLAFHNSASVPNNQLEAFYNTLKVETLLDLGLMNEPDYNNLSAWMDVMTVHFYPGKGENSPVVYTVRSGGEPSLEDIHYDVNIHTGKWVKDNPEPKVSNDVAITVHTSLGADVQNCVPSPELASWGCTL